MLHSGLDIQNAIRMTADKLSEPRAKAGMLEVQDAIKSRGEIAESMREQGKRFPNLMTDLVQVGEHTQAHCLKCSRASLSTTRPTFG